MVDKAEAQVRCHEEEADCNRYRKTHANESRSAKEALDTYESKVGREEEGGLVALPFIRSHVAAGGIIERILLVGTRITALIFRQEVA